MKEKGLRGDFKPWAGKARRMGGDLSRDGEGCGLDITCLACLPVHVCAYDTCKWRRQRGSWVCRPQTQGQLRLEERVLYRERAQTFRPQDLPSRCSTASRIIF